jgi:hypothetical protein
MVATPNNEMAHRTALHARGTGPLWACLHARTTLPEVLATFTRLAFGTGPLGWKETCPSALGRDVVSIWTGSAGKAFHIIMCR